MGSLTQAIAKAATGFGAEILINTEVAEITTKDGATTGVLLSNGDQITAKAVVSAADMRTTFLKLLDPYYLDQMFVKHVQNIKHRGTLARVHFALDTLPSFTALNGDAQQLLSGHVQIAPTMRYLQDAFDPAKYGRYPEKPYLDIQIPTLTDPTLAPDGKHLMSVSVKYMPYHLKQGNWDELREASCAKNWVSWQFKPFPNMRPISRRLCSSPESSLLWTWKTFTACLRAIQPTVI
jgi:phytoene dehydrogenase-like protein